MKNYQIIYADPPWKQNKGGLRKVRPNQNKCLDYPTMSINEIRRIFDVVPKAENHALFVWTIDKFLMSTEAMLSDYKLHARFVWDKENGVAPAFTVRFSHEYLLWFYKGNFLKISSEFRGKFTTVMREKSRRHSQKPEAAYRMIENFYPNENKLELFARSKRIGWDCWGNEIENDIILTSISKTGGAE
jgi:N6-adenosine-specific RNA methylase IME4